MQKFGVTMPKIVLYVFASGIKSRLTDQDIGVQSF